MPQRQSQMKKSMSFSVRRWAVPAVLALVLTVFGTGAWALKCDVDNNGRIDKVDIGLILQDITLKKPVSGPDDPRDADSNNTLNAIDTRLCTLRCTYSTCATNGVPVAQAGDAVTVSVGGLVTLNGSASSDPDGDVIRYQWSFRTRPSNSQASLTEATSVSPSFIADRAGTFEVTLVVSDGTASGAPSSVTVTALDAPPVAMGIGSITPAEGDVLPADARPLISAVFVSNGSSVDPSSVVVELDGRDVTALATVLPTGVRFVPAEPLPEGAHTLRISVTDPAGARVTRSVNFTTASAPVISGQAPADVFLPGGSSPAISAVLSDIGSGVDPTSVRVFFNEVDVTANVQVSVTGLHFQVPRALDDAMHTVRVTARDRAGNATESTWRFGTATLPEILAVSPPDSLLPAGARPTISATYRDTRVGINVSAVRLYVNSVDVTALSTVTESQISYTPAEPMGEGPVTVYVDVFNRANAMASRIWGFEVNSPSTYSVRFVSPAMPMTTAAPKIQVTAAALANKALVRDVTLNGDRMRVVTQPDGSLQYVSDIDLADGENILSLVATFDDGESRSASTRITYDAPPRVTITAPADGSTLGPANATSPRDLTGRVERPVTITGRVSKPVVSVSINQQQAQLSGQDFRFDNFFLHEGVNLVKVTAIDAAGRVGTAAITLSVDQTAPILTVEQPRNGTVTSGNSVDVRGIANDAVEGLAGAPEPTVTVSSTARGGTVRAQVADRYYLATDVPLAVGENILTLTATDQAGNARTSTVTVTRLAVGSERLAAASARSQQGSMHVELPEPLVVTALGRSGSPLPGVPVSFDVLRGTGWISGVQGRVQKPDGVNPARTLVVTTDESGEARVWFTPGKQAGAGAHAVRAWVNAAVLSANAPGSTITDELTFHATTARGLPAQVLSDMGTNQYAEVRSQPLELLSAVVRDEFNNLLPNLPVTFRIESGDAYFLLPNGDRSDNNGRSITVTTDKNGFVAVRPTLGETPGEVRVRAGTLADPANPAAGEVGNAVYVIQALAPQDGPTAFVGRIFTDKNKPLPGVRVSIGRTSLSSTTDDLGHFRIDNVPPGRVDLFIDGRTSSFQNQIWPSLHFESTAIRGRDNSLAHPIYLPPLAMAGAKTVGGNEDVILKIAGLEGFQMKVKANSVTFPDGSKVGTLVVSPVVADRLPMAPPAGAANFGIPAWTIQPAGTRFDPPIEVTMPNTRAMRPGETVPVVQWDHDLAQFVPMGHATVSEDGAVMVTDPGSGVTKAGWGGACVYDPTNCGRNAPPECGDCFQLSSARCPSCEWSPGPFKEKTSNAFSLTLAEAKLRTGIFAKLANFFGVQEVGVKGKILGMRSVGVDCCAARQQETETVSFPSIGSDVELEIAATAPFGRAGVIGALAAAAKLEVVGKAKFVGSVSGSAKYEYCKQAWDATGTGAASLLGELGVQIGREFAQDFKVKGAALGGFAGTGGFELSSIPTLSLNGFLQLTFYLKAELEAFNLKITPVNQAWVYPLIGSTHIGDVVNTN
jgi:large repetitive protein